MDKLHYAFYSHPKITAGACALESIPTELANNDAYKPLVITSRQCRRRKLDKTLVRAFADSNCPIGGIFDEVRDYAGIALARQAAVLFAERGCDAVIALGGGPVTDVARAANLLVSHDTTDLFQFFNGTPIRSRMRPLVMIPACCPGGNESGQTLSVDNRRLRSEFFYPDVIILDKRMTPACSRQCAAESGVIALDNAVTALTDTEHNPMREAFSHAALRFAAGSLKKFIRRPKNKKHSLAMANAGILAGIAAANAKPGLVRGLSEALEKYTGISRAVFMRILIPPALDWLRQKCGPPGDDLLLGVAGMETFAATPEHLRAEKGVELLLSLFRQTALQIPQSLAELNLPAYKMKRACQDAGARPDFAYSVQECWDVIQQSRKGDFR